MPVTIGLLLFTLGAPLGVVNFVAIGTGAAIINALGSVALGLAVGAASLLLNRTSVPKPEDGKYNLKQPVPPLVRIYGTVKKGSDYLALEEKDGIAYHVMSPASHRINAFVGHYLHDDLVTLDEAGLVTDPPHYNPYVGINAQLGFDTSTAYAQMVAAFPDIWTADHRGDGIATVIMTCGSAAAEDLQTVYPNNMPVHTAEIEGALVHDARDGISRFTRNLALIRADHLMHPSGGGKLTSDDLYWPDWAHAANVCDQSVTNRTGASVPRYHGGIWYRYTDSPVEVGRLIDEAAELVIYERPDGKIGVHAGEYVEPDIRLTADDIISVDFDANKRRATNVLAVRGRYTDRTKGYSTVDAAIYGDPYVADDSERSRTIENQVVQDHNHMARLQKLRYIRANAPRVTIAATYEAARDVPYRRFIKVHLPPRLNEAVVEIVSRPVLSLKSLTYTFDVIVVPATLYAFNAASEEGTPGNPVTPIERGVTPVPQDFSVGIGSADIGGGVYAIYASATWTPMLPILTVEVQWQQTAGGSIGSVTTGPGISVIDTGNLIEGAEYRFRARAWAPGGRASLWTEYVTATAISAVPGTLDFSSAVQSGQELDGGWM